MKRLILLTAALLAMLGAQSQTPAATEMNYAIVTGEYEKEYEPDEIYVQITIQEKDSKGRVSIEEQQRAMIKTLKECGIDVNKALSTKYISSSFYKKGQNLAYGVYELKLSSSEEFYKAYTALKQLALSSVSIGRIDRSDREKLKLDISAEAMKNARHKVNTIAAADKIKAGKCTYFIDDVSTSRRTTSMSFDEFDSAEALDEIPTMPKIGTVTIRATVQARFQLE